MADQLACSVTHFFRTLSRAQVIQKSPFLMSPSFLPVQLKPKRHKTTGYVQMSFESWQYLATRLSQS